MAPIILVTGAARSGKSEWAEQLAIAQNRSVCYVATGIADDQDLEWQQRIEQHRRRRPVSWSTQEEPYELARLCRNTSDCLLIDSLGTWVANGLERSDGLWQQSVRDLLAALQQASVPIILVSEETGWGIVPAYPLGRLFRDRLGQLSRQIAREADAIYLIVQGFALDLRQLAQPLPSPET
jgi:adenosylcobinamide kinase / adenosylcobinamide-phosphate guanylyltransferase